ncbi:hypothetical protein [Shinella oryzae]|uniref:hypothetical protein n=1 Tax=Shinella oryzae TaxID=2871820 RepID=UPI001FF3A688|nr:hypothetical protein [Shinella oryzae]UPA25347.1 hypothetical protein K6301_03855 [Shinella oryzae]
MKTRHILSFLMFVAASPASAVDFPFAVDLSKEAPSQAKSSIIGKGTGFLNIGMNYAGVVHNLEREGFKVKYATSPTEADIDLNGKRVHVASTRFKSSAGAVKTDDNGKEEISVAFTSEVSQSTLYYINRTMYMKVPSKVDVVMAGLNEKYGTPTIPIGRRSFMYRYIWYYDVNGKVLPSEKYCKGFGDSVPNVIGNTHISQRILKTTQNYLSQNCGGVVDAKFWVDGGNNDVSRIDLSVYDNSINTSGRELDIDFLKAVVEYNPQLVEEAQPTKPKF